MVLNRFALPLQHLLLRPHVSVYGATRGGQVVVQVRRITEGSGRCMRSAGLRSLHEGQRSMGGAPGDYSCVYQSCTLQYCDTMSVLYYRPMPPTLLLKLNPSLPTLTPPHPLPCPTLLFPSLVATMVFLLPSICPTKLGGDQAPRPHVFLGTEDSSHKPPRQTCYLRSPAAHGREEVERHFDEI